MQEITQSLTLLAENNDHIAPRNGTVYGDFNTAHLLSLLSVEILSRITMIKVFYKEISNVLFVYNTMLVTILTISVHSIHLIKS